MSFKHSWIQGLRQILSVSLVSSVCLSTSPHLLVLSFSAGPLLCSLEQWLPSIHNPRGKQGPPPPPLSQHTNVPPREASLSWLLPCPSLGRLKFSFTGHPRSQARPSTEEAGRFRPASGGPTAWGRGCPKKHAQQTKITRATALWSLGVLLPPGVFLYLFIPLAVTKYLWFCYWTHTFHSFIEQILTKCLQWARRWAGHLVRPLFLTTALQAGCTHHPNTKDGGSEAQRRHVTHSWGKLKAEFEAKAIWLERLASSRSHGGAQFGQRFSLVHLCSKPSI